MSLTLPDGIHLITECRMHSKNTMTKNIAKGFRTDAMKKMACVVSIFEG